MEPGSYTLRPTQWLTFSFFFYWLDTGELPPIDKDNTDIWYFILRAYHFADFYMVQGFANTILDLFISTLIAE
jgi:hypothetical protein